MKFLRLSFFFLSLCVEFGVQYIFPNNNIFRNPRLLPLFIAINSEKPQSSATSPQASSSSPSSSSSPNDRYIHPQVFKMFQRANHLAKNGDNITARRLLARCIELSPMDSHSWLALARLEAKWGNIDRARELFTESVQHFPTNVHILQAWGHMEQKFGNDTFARACLEQALEIEPLNAYVCHTLSSIEIRHENIDRARRILDPVFRRRPTSAIAICYADMERREGNIDKANEILLQALKTCKYDKCDILLSLAWLEEDALGNPEEAYNLIDMALKQQPSNIKIYIAKANMELRLNKFAKARQTLQHALTLQSDDGKHYTMLGSLELELGNYREAQRVLLAGVALFPGDFFLLQRLGALESKHGSAKRARDIFNRAIMIQPHAPTFVAWAILEESLGNLAITPKIAKSKLIEQNTQSLPLQEVTDFFNGSDNDARNSSQSALDRDLNPEFKDPVAALEFADSQFKKARELFSLGAIVDSRHGPLYHAYGSMEMRHGNASGARQIFQRAIESNCSDLPTIYHGLAILEVKDGHKDLAAQTFKKGIEAGLRKTEVDPSLRYLFHSLGMLELDGHRVAEAERVFQSGIKLFPTHSHLLLGLALAETKLGRAELARRHFKEAVDADVYHAHAWQCWALFEKQSGNIELATILFKQGLKKNPTHAPLWQAFALMEVHQGNADAARSLFAESIKRCPSHAHTYQAWACLEMKLGNLAQAKELTWQGE